MDSGEALRCSHHLARLSPSTSHPPLGERTRQSRKNHSHFDAHTMGDHEFEVPKQPSSPHPLWEIEPSRTYGNLLGYGHHVDGPSHEYLS